MSLRLPRTAPGLTLAPALVLGLALTLTGCGANFEADTYATRTVADGTNAAVGAIAIRNITIVAPEAGDTHDAGEDVEVLVTLTNDGPDDDQLVGVSSPAADSVEILVEGEESDELELPRLGTTGGQASLRLLGLTEDLRPGRYVEMTLRFATNGEVIVQVPVATTGEYDDTRERNPNFHEIGGEHGGGDSE